MPRSNAGSLETLPALSAEVARRSHPSEVGGAIGVRLAPQPPEGASTDTRLTRRIPTWTQIGVAVSEMRATPAMPAYQFERCCITSTVAA